MGPWFLRQRKNSRWFVIAKEQTGLSNVASRDAVQREIGPTGVDRHCIVGIVQIVVCTKEEHRLILTCNVHKTADADEVRIGGPYVTRRIADGDIAEYGVLDVVGCGDSPLHDVRLASLDAGEIV